MKSRDYCFGLLKTVREVDILCFCDATFTVRAYTKTELNLCNSQQTKDELWSYYKSKPSSNFFRYAKSLRCMFILSVSMLCSSSLMLVQNFVSFTSSVRSQLINADNISKYTCFC